jgi:8-oxo-dGTP pyrophosphatase MutT (NUDIX family)
MTIGVAVYVRRGGKILLAQRMHTSTASGTWGAPGGTVERGEDVESAARREACEEAGILPIDLAPIGHLEFQVDVPGWQTLDDPFYVAHFFESNYYEGRTTESTEARPAWIEEDQLPWDLMWPTDKYWLPFALAGYTVSANVSLASESLTAQALSIAIRLGGSKGTSEDGRQIGPRLVILTGPPAVGKTTLTPILKQVLQQRQARAISVSTDDVIRIQYPDRLAGSPDTFVSPYLVDGDAIVFSDHSRRELTKRATAGLIGLCETLIQQSNSDTTIICELPRRELIFALDCIRQTEALRRTKLLMVELTADPHICEARNDRRLHGSRLPELAQTYMAGGREPLLANRAPSELRDLDWLASCMVNTAGSLTHSQARLRSSLLLALGQ